MVVFVWLGFFGLFWVFFWGGLFGVFFLCVCLVSVFKQYAGDLERIACDVGGASVRVHVCLECACVCVHMYA